MREKQVGIRLPIKEYEALVELAHSKGTNVTNLIRPYIYELLGKVQEVPKRKILKAIKP